MSSVSNLATQGNNGAYPSLSYSSILSHLFRVQLNKAVTESQDEIADLKGKMRALTHQFDQMKEEIIAKVGFVSKKSTGGVVVFIVEIIAIL
jgi:hypothetical protein